MICANCRREIADCSNFCYYCGAKQFIAPSGQPVAQKRLMRSSTDSKIAGVCGGFAEYLGADPTVIRLIWVLAFIFSGFVPGGLAYIVAWLVMPLAPLYVPAAAAQPQSSAAAAPQTTQNA